MKTIIEEALDAFNAYPELCKRFGVEDPNKFDPTCLFDNDPEILRYQGECLFFTDLVVDGRRFVLTSQDLDVKEREMLEEWSRDDFQTHYRVSEENSWSSFNDLEDAIAYRGGSGYQYTIHEYCA